MDLNSLESVRAAAAWCKVMLQSRGEMLHGVVCNADTSGKFFHSKDGVLSETNFSVMSYREEVAAKL